MKQKSLLLVVTTTSLFCGSMQDSTSQTEKQKVNFCGILRSAANPSVEIHIENVGMPSYKRIQVYEKPSNLNDPCVDPHKSTAELNLKDIRSLKRKPLSPEYLEMQKNLPEKETAPCAGTYRFKGRKYVEIEVVFNDPHHTKRSFLVEDSRRIIYDEILDGSLLKRKINIVALDSLEIKGHYEVNEDDKERTPGARCKMIISGQEQQAVKQCPKPATVDKEVGIKIPVNTSK